MPFYKTKKDLIRRNVSEGREQDIRDEMIGEQELHLPREILIESPEDMCKEKPEYSKAYLN